MTTNSLLDFEQFIMCNLLYILYHLFFPNSYITTTIFHIFTDILVSFRTVFLPTYKEYVFDAEIIFKMKLSLLTLTIYEVGFRGCVRVRPFLAVQLVENYETEVFHAVSAHLFAWVDYRQDKTLRSEEGI